MYQVETDSQAATTTTTAGVCDTSKGPEDLLEIKSVGPLPPSNGFTYIPTAVDVFSRYKVVIPLRRPNAQLVVKGPVLIFTRLSYVPNTLLTDKVTAFTAKIVNGTTEQARISNKHATIWHAQTIGMTDRTHQKLKTIPKINISSDQPKWD